MISIQNTTLFSLCIMVCLGGCTRALPLISHAHIGHSLTAWRDTPGNQGLFVVAEKETQIALEQAELAKQPALSKITSARHLSNVIHALDPTRRSHGDGLGYGAIRALEGSYEHIQFSAETDDASANIITMSERYTEAALKVIERMRLASEVAQLAEQAYGNERSDISQQLYQILLQTLEGEDHNGDGVIGPDLTEWGLTQLRDEVSASLRKENPPYHPVGRKYLLGLIRMPNGDWIYRFDTEQTNNSTYSYGY